MAQGTCLTGSFSMAGFSMLEFTNSLSAALVLGTALVSGVQDFILDNQRCAVVNQLLTGLRMARSASNETAQMVTVCPSADGAHCRGDGNWNGGWVAFVDLNSDGQMQAAESNFLIAKARNTSKRVTLSSEQTHFSFIPFYARPFTAVSTTGTLCVRDSRGAEHTRTITLDTVGPPRLTSPRPDSDTAGKRTQDSSQQLPVCT